MNIICSGKQFLPSNGEAYHEVTGSKKTQQIWMETNLGKPMAWCSFPLGPGNLGKPFRDGRWPDGPRICRDVT
jgi:hypothetical protein